MTDLKQLLLLGLVVLVASAVPFVPTGELVSGAAALAAPSAPAAVALFVLAWICSCAGDTLLLCEVRLLSRRLQRWRARAVAHPRLGRAEERLSRNTFAAVVTARLVPGMRAPVILALGLSGARRRTFVAADLVGCGLWAALYTSAGAVGGRLTSHPVPAVLAAVLLAAAVGALGRRLLRRRRAAQQTSETTPDPRAPIGGGS